MNVLDAQVIKILETPTIKYGKWCVEVEYTCWGSPGTTYIFFETKEEAEKIAPGYTILI